MRLWEAAAQPLRLDLEERLGIRKAGQPVSAEAVEADALPRRLPDGGPGLAGNDDLPSVGRRADTSRGVDGQTDVPDVGQRRTAAVNSDTDEDIDVVGPDLLAERALDGRGRLDGGGGPLEDGEELVGAGVDLAAAGSRHRGPQDASDVVQQVAIAVAQP